MADLIKFIYGTEAEILALTPSDKAWVNRAFYYPSDQEYFYQSLDGVMKLYGRGTSAGVGCRLNGEIIGGVKRYIEQNDTLEIPVLWQYNVKGLLVDGAINADGEINAE